MNTQEFLDDAVKTAELHIKEWRAVATALRKAKDELSNGALGAQAIEAVEGFVHGNPPTRNGVMVKTRNGTIIGDIMHVLRDGKETDLMDLQQEVNFKRGEETKISGVLSTETNKPKAERRVERTGPGMYRLAR